MQDRYRDYWAADRDVNGKRAVLVAYWQDLAGYYRTTDGTVWSHGCGSSHWINRGGLTKDDFGPRFRGNWVAD